MAHRCRNKRIEFTVVIGAIADMNGPNVVEFHPKLVLRLICVEAQCALDYVGSR